MLILIYQSAGGLNFRRELLALLGQGPEITLNLQAVPKFGGLAEEGAEADRADLAGVIARRLRTISLTAQGCTPIARAMAFWEIPIGNGYSSRRISPGVIGGFMATE